MTTTLDARAINSDPTSYSLTTGINAESNKQIKLTVSASADKAGAKIKLVGTDLDGDAIQELNLDIGSANSAAVVTDMKFAGIDAAGITITGIDDGTTITITQPAVVEVVYPVEDDVEFGVQFGADGAEFEGDLVLPIEADVRFEIGYGADGSEFEGEYDEPASIRSINLESKLDGDQ